MKLLLITSLFTMVLVASGCGEPTKSASSSFANPKSESVKSVARADSQVTSFKNEEDAFKTRLVGYDKDCPAAATTSIDALKCRLAGEALQRDLQGAATDRLNEIAGLKQDQAITENAKAFRVGKINLGLKDLETLQVGLKEKSEFYDKVWLAKTKAYDGHMDPKFVEQIKQNYCHTLQARVTLIRLEVELGSYESSLFSDPLKSEEKGELLRTTIRALPSLEKYCGQEIGPEISALEGTLKTLSTPEKETQKKITVEKLCRQLPLADQATATELCKKQSLSLSFLSWLEHKTQKFQPKVVEGLNAKNLPLESLENLSSLFSLTDDTGVFSKGLSQDKTLYTTLNPILGVRLEMLSVNALIPEEAANGQFNLTAPPVDFVAPVSELEWRLSETWPRTEQGRIGKRVAIRALQLLDGELNHFNYYNAEVLYCISFAFLSVAQDILPESPGLAPAYEFIAGRKVISGDKISPNEAPPEFLKSLDPKLDLKLGTEMMNKLKTERADDINR